MASLLGFGGESGDNTKIGILCCSLGVLFILLGVLFFFDAGLLAIGNVLFLVGIPLILTVKRTVAFFTSRERLRGTVCFFLGISLVLARWALVGMIVELIGAFELFGRFLPIVVSLLERAPYIGPVLRLPAVSAAVGFLSGRKAERRPPV